jgi:UDP-glucose 4-epimerase
VTGSKLQIQYEPAGQTFVKNRVGCPKKAMRELNFTAGVELRDGLRKLIEWRDNHKAEVASRRKAAGVAEL